MGLTYLDLSVLNAIYETQGYCTQKVISERIHLLKQSVNVLIRSFWEQGYVELRELASDRRNKEIHFTSSGQEYANRIIGRLLRTEQAIIAPLTSEQRRAMIDLINRMLESLREAVQTDFIKSEDT